MQPSPLRAAAVGAALALSLAACQGSESYGETTTADGLAAEEARPEVVDANSAVEATAPALLGTASVAVLGLEAPNFRLLDSNGNSHDLADFRGEPVVLEWINHGCPFVKKHYASGNMQSLQERYTDQGVTWLAICSSAPGKQGYHSPDGWNDAIAEHGNNATAVLIDETGLVGKAYDARTTPHMYVIDADGTLVYSGAIDSDSSPNAAAIEGATNYVAETLDLLLAGNEVEPASSKPYGCSVKYMN